MYSVNSTNELWDYSGESFSDEEGVDTKSMDDIPSKKMKTKFDKEMRKINFLLEKIIERACKGNLKKAVGNVKNVEKRVSNFRSKTKDTLSDILRVMAEKIESSKEEEDKIKIKFFLREKADKILGTIILNKLDASF